ncbi:Ig-like domain-containing domain [Hymenobacter psychrotolerans]|uniref:Ig-like domain-containing protein n=1 Tax=Hymenobacter psychrotolerans DSM 18569 TaxID=1121959 RepID=A0A1M6Q9C3_9BACT|nr:Ig-like domain-containing domain [Hymenobacter psychrotolerans]SHK16756.1 Ig-like domain-containing protein [Hymenobacter psychrotolerans DSM 18569]
MSARANLFLLFSVAAAVAGCASVSSPQGGPRDVTPPKLVSSSPVNGARNARPQQVRLVFSEAVQVKDLQKNLIIAPTIAEDNKYKVREERNAITLLFEKPLEENTTYSFNFGNAISDITESLPAADAIISFSTGAVLDSGAVQGTVRGLLTQKPAEAAAVLLYPEADTAGLRRGKPYYLARSDKAGAYKLRNLKAGRYRLYALIDKNQNTRYDEGEKIAYLPQPITVGSRPDTVRLELVRPDGRRPLVSGQQAAPTQYRVSYNEGLRSATLAPLGGTGSAALAEAVQLAEAGRTVALYRTAALTEGRYLLAATDSAGNTGRDTVTVKFQGTAPARRLPLYTVEGNPRDVYRQGEVRYTFAEPIRVAPGKPFATLQEDSSARRPLLLGPDGTLNPDRLHLTVLLNTKAKSSLTLQLDTLNLTTISGQRLGARPLRLRVTEQATTGSLAGTVQTKYKRYEIQLLDAQGVLVATFNKPGPTFRFDRVAPGTYTIRVLIDADANGSWRGADPNLLLPPEPVYLLPQPVQVRANWEVEDLRLTF